MSAGRGSALTDDKVRRLAHLTFVLIALFYLLDAVVPPTASIAAGRGWYWGGGLTATMLIAITTLFPIAGLLIARRQPRNAVAWVMLAIGLVFVLRRSRYRCTSGTAEQSASTRSQVKPLRAISTRCCGHR